MPTPLLASATVVARTLAALAVVLLPGAATVAAQDLPFKRQVPGTGAFQCPSFPTPVLPDAVDRTRARQLASTASQELILGNRERARELLAQAVDLDPASAEQAYQHARVLEDLGEADQAVAEYCRAVALDPTGDETSDARARVETLTEAARPSLPESAVSAFRSGLSQIDLGQPFQAATSFERAAVEAPQWPEAHYNHGVVLARLDRREAARLALRRYLQLAPDAPDAIAVSERIGQLQVVAAASVPSPGAALAVGLIPGMGQVYTGRPGPGLGFLGLAGGAAATGLLYERGTQPDFRPVGLALAGTATLVSALDGFFHARRTAAGSDAAPPGATTALGLGIVPGLGQVYSGRTGAGLSFLSMVAATTTASDLLETRPVRRFAPQGLAVAGALTAVGALEAFVMADLHQGPEPFRPDPWMALGLGVIPGMGQFYSGRTGMGMTVLGLSAGFTTAGLIYRIGRGVTFRREGLAIGAGVLGLGAVEAFIWALRHQDDPLGGTGDRDAAPRPGSPTFQGPGLVGVGSGAGRGVPGAGVALELRLLGVRF